MAIELGGDRIASTPVVKRREIGEQFRGAVVNETQRGRNKQDGTIILNSKGKQAQEAVITVLVLKSTMIAGIGGEEGVPTEGDTVRIICPGGAFKQWIDAKKALSHRLRVGDIIEMSTTYAERYDSDGNKKGEFRTQEELTAHRLKYMANPLAGGTIGMRGTMTVRDPKPDEAHWVARCEAAYMATQQRTEVAPLAPAFDPDEF